MIFRQDPYASLSLRAGAWMLSPFFSRIPRVRTGKRDEPSDPCARVALGCWAMVGLSPADRHSASARVPPAALPAHLHRACARQPARVPRLRRADLGARRVGAGADPQTRMRDPQDELGLTFPFISHDPPPVRHMADEVGVMYPQPVSSRSPPAAHCLSARATPTRACCWRPSPTFPCRVGATMRCVARSPTRSPCHPAAASTRVARSQTCVAGARRRSCASSTTAGVARHAGGGGARHDRGGRGDLHGGVARRRVARRRAPKCAWRKPAAGRSPWSWAAAVGWARPWSPRCARRVATTMSPPIGRRSVPRARSARRGPPIAAGPPQCDARGVPTLVSTPPVSCTAGMEPEQELARARCGLPGARVRDQTRSARPLMKHFLPAAARPPRGVRHAVGARGQASATIGSAWLVRLPRPRRRRSTSWCAPPRSKLRHCRPQAICVALHPARFTPGCRRPSPSPGCRPGRRGGGAPARGDRGPPGPGDSNEFFDRGGEPVPW